MREMCKKHKERGGHEYVNSQSWCQCKMERWAVKQIKGLAYNDLVASKTDRQTVKKLFKGESMRAVTLLNTLLNQILRESEHFFIHTERKKSCVLPFSVKEEW